MGVEISVIIPVYNVEDYLRKCVDSILNQTYSNFELILINDGSTDSSGEICDEYKKNDSRIEVIHQENQGVGNARNNGLNIAKGKYIYFCDPDDYINRNLFSDNIKYAKDLDLNMVIFGNYEQTGNKLEPITYESSYFKTKNDFRNKFLDLFLSHNMHVLWNKLYKKEIIDNNNIRFTNKKVGEDSTFNKLIYKNLDNVYVNNKLYYYHVTRKDSAQNIFQKDKFDMRYSETFELEQLIKSWDLYNKEYESLITKDWIKTLFVGLENVFHQDSPYNTSDKLKVINYMLNKPKIRLTLKELPFSNLDSFFKRIIYSFIKLKLYYLVPLAYQMRKSLKKESEIV